MRHCSEGLRIVGPQEEPGTWPANQTLNSMAAIGGQCEGGAT
jgi:hypothetical protein